ncbi:uncharacterized protein atf5a [Paramormyrops kingsleyae]|uniref:Activating transcription factor 5a n=1 Tax=Paramormyrops kingsleyae TaxID=1676925 RepID=A0A3B3Q3C6_9TELE|nr:uncharacterized protein LOC111846265 [Paramormyrops kingsleyae]
MMATSVPLWKTLLVCPVDPLDLSPPQANHSQLQGRRGEEPEESQRLSGDGLTDWMTEEVDFSSYLPTPHSSPSPNSSLPPSPLQHDIQVPSDLEVMTSLLQEELAQLEDYFLSDSIPEKVGKLGKCDKIPSVVGPQSYYQLPYASYNSSQSESSPLLVTLATGELDLLSFCGGPIGRPKTPRHAPYNCSRPISNGRKRVSDGMRAGEGIENSIWSSKGNNSGSPEVTINGNYCCVEGEKFGKGYCVGGAVDIRKCTILPKEEKSCFMESTTNGEKMFGGYGFSGPLDVPHKKEDQLMYGAKEVSGSDDSMEMETFHESKSCDVAKAIPWKTETGEGCFLHATADAYHNFLGVVDESMRAGVVEVGHRHGGFHAGFLEDQSSKCHAEGLELGSSAGLPPQGLKEDPGTVTPEHDTAPLEVQNGERKQKKRDQNKTAAHRYRQRKRAELDSLEEQLHGLEGRNRELRDKAESVEREIQYVKDLLIEVYKARSQRLKQDTSA